MQLGAAGDRDRFQGDLAEVIVFNTELSDADRATVLAALRAKYGLQAAVRNLPADPVNITPTLDGGTFWFRQGVTVVMSTADRRRRDTLHDGRHGARPVVAPLFRADSS